MAERISEAFPRELLNLITEMNITPENVVVENVLDREAEFISKYYTPTSSISEAARKFLEEVESGRIRTTVKSVKSNSLGSLFIRSKFKDHYPFLMVYARIIMLEVVALVYVLDYRPEYRHLLSQDDIKQTRETVKYVIDILGLDPRYSSVIDRLQDLNIDLGYIQGQIPLIKEEVNQR